MEKTAEQKLHIAASWYARKGKKEYYHAHRKGYIDGVTSFKQALKKAILKNLALSSVDKEYFIEIIDHVERPKP